MQEIFFERLQIMANITSSHDIHFLRTFLGRNTNSDLDSYKKGKSNQSGDIYEGTKNFKDCKKVLTSERN